MITEPGAKISWENSRLQQYVDLHFDHCGFYGFWNTRKQNSRSQEKLIIGMKNKN